MEMTGEYRIAAPRDQVWAALNDPDILKASIPGCDSLEKTSDTEMTAKVVSKIGPVKATFTGKVRLENIMPPESYTISGEGQGGVAGFAKGGADVRLTEDGAVTVLTYTARAQIGGKLAQLGARLIDSTAKMMADQFFAKFSSIVGGDAAVAVSGPDDAAATIAPSAEQTSAIADAAATAIAGAPPIAMAEEPAASSATSAAQTATPAAQAAASASAGARATATGAAPMAAAPSGSGVTQWVVPLVTFIAGVVIGKYLLGH